MRRDRHECLSHLRQRGVRYTFANMATASGGARFEFASDQSLLVYFDELKETGRAESGLPQGEKSRAQARPLQSQIALQANEKVRKLLRLLEMDPLAGVRNVHPAYCSLLVKFDGLRLRHDEVEAVLRRYLERLEEIKLPEPRLVEIPVCYGGELGPDLAEVCAIHGMRPARVVELHASAEYLVYFLGFVPGFAYLGELPEALVTPRLAVPRRRVPAGSVGIAGNQTGVYPFATPGGWRLIGRTPVAMFRRHQDPMNLLQIGDHVRFRPISKEEFAEFSSR